MRFNLNRLIAFYDERESLRISICPIAHCRMVTLPLSQIALLLAFGGIYFDCAFSERANANEHK